MNLGQNGIYIGQVDENNKPDGIGREIQKDGSVYEGQFQNGIAHGWGREFYAGGRYYIGCWKLGDYHGFGQRFEPDGTIIETGWFKESKIVNEQFSISTVNHHRKNKTAFDQAYKDNIIGPQRHDVDFMNYSSSYGKMYRRSS